MAQEPKAAIKFRVVDGDFLGFEVNLLCFYIHCLRMKVKPFCLHRTEGANNHIKQGDAYLLRS